MASPSGTAEGWTLKVLGFSEVRRAAYPELSDFVVPALWLSVPIAVALAQVWRPTLLGWILLLAGFTIVAIGLCYLVVRDGQFDPWPLTFLAAAIAICVGLCCTVPRADARRYL
jgi:hypothetical protein